MHNNNIKFAYTFFFLYPYRSVLGGLVKGLALHTDSRNFCWERKPPKQVRSVQVRWCWAFPLPGPLDHEENRIVDEFAGDRCMLETDMDCSEQVCCHKSIDSFGFMHFLHSNLPEMQFQTQSMGAAMQLPEGAGSEATEADPLGLTVSHLHSSEYWDHSNTTIGSGIFPNQRHSGMVLHLALKPIHSYFTICILKGMQMVSKDRMAKQHFKLLHCDIWQLL